MQYWDKNTPEEVTRILQANRTKCAGFGIDWLFFDEDTAFEFIKRTFPAEPGYAEAYRAAPHPAMKADLFRLFFLLGRGGAYLDADMYLKTSPQELFASGAAVFIQRTSKNQQLTNWFMVAPPGMELFRLLAGAAVRSMLESGPDAANAWELTGPGLLTRVVGQYLHDAAGRPADPVRILSDDQGSQLIGLKHDLSYKTTERHWQNYDKVRRARALDAEIAADAQNPEGYFRKSDLLERAFQTAAAAEPARMAYSLGGGLPKYAVHYGRILFELSRFDEARATAQEGLRRYPTNAGLTLIMARLALHEDRPRAAFRLANRALKFGVGDRSAAYTVMARALHRAGHSAWAKSLADRAVLADRRSSAARKVRQMLARAGADFAG